MALHIDDETSTMLSSHLSEDEEFYLDIEKRQSYEWNAPRSLGYALPFNVLLFVCSIAMFGLSWTRLNGQVTEIKMIQDTSYYSPLFDQIDIRLQITQINGTLLDTQPPSIYRQDPSPEVDAAWDRIANVRTTAVSRDDVVKLGKDPAVTAKYPNDFGLGPDAYVAEVDVFHQIHCLDSLRREIHFDHYYSHKYPKGKPDRLHRQHTSHCIYILLQNLMCSSSIDIITHRWLDVQKHPFPDFNINKQCRNFDDVLAWQEKNAVDDVPYMKLRRPVDMEPVKTSDNFKDIFRQWNYKKNDEVHEN